VVYRHIVRVSFLSIVVAFSTGVLPACSGSLDAPGEPADALATQAHAATGEVASEKTSVDEEQPARPKASDQADLPRSAANTPSSEADEPDAGKDVERADTTPVVHSDLTAQATPEGTQPVQRPKESLGVGFFVRDGKLYDFNGNEFRVRGVNKLHWDVDSRGLLRANANATRWTVDFTLSPEKNVALLQGAPGHGGTIAENSVVIPGNWDGTCKDDAATFTRIVDTWVQQAASWQQLEKHMILNIANEWGARDSTVWRDLYKDAIARLRAAGYHATISVTAGGCGQDPGAIVKYGQEIFESDPEKNVIFDQHIYGEYQDVAGGAPGKFDDQPQLDEHFAALAATGLVVVLGEFGPGRDIGPSPTTIDPLRVVELAERHGLGWLAWAWDDNNLSEGVSDDHGFGMSVHGAYDASEDLTLFGRAVVEHPKWGLKALAQRASIFN
jgi:mannan endo-1,4-beta-mannosidase